MSLRDKTSAVHDCSSPVFQRNTLWVDEHRQLSPAFQRNALCSYIAMMIQLSHKMFLTLAPKLQRHADSVGTRNSFCFKLNHDYRTKCSSGTIHPSFRIVRPRVPAEHFIGR